MTDAETGLASNLNVKQFPFCLNMRITENSQFASRVSAMRVILLYYGALICKDMVHTIHEEQGFFLKKYVH